MDTIIRLKDLREHLPLYEKQIQTGRSFLVMKRSKPIFTIHPIDTDGWETVIDFTKFRRGGIFADELLARLKKKR